MQASDVPYKFSVGPGSSADPSFLTDPVPPTAAGAVASQALLFPPETAQVTGTPPTIQDMNGLLFYAAIWANWFQAGGPVVWDTSFSSNFGGYPKGAIVQSASVFGKFWLCTADNNTSNPDTGGSNWSAFELTTANPSATAGPTAVNGSALTLMRSDAAPAVQTATTGQRGLVQPDGTTIRIDGSGVISATGSPNIVVLTASSGSFTVPGGVYSLDVEAWGGGAGSGATTGGATNNCGSTGGGGGYSRAVFATAPAVVIPYTVGAGGSAGLSGGTAPGDGGSTTFSTITAGGGGQGTNGTAGGPPAGGGNGGLSSGGTLNYPGQNGSSYTLNGASGVVTALGGGASYTFPSITAFSGDHVGTTPSWPGVAGVPAITNSGTNFNGGTGAPGQIIIRYWN